MSDPRSILEAAKTIAVVGISQNESKAAFGIPAGLQSSGFRIIPVNPNADEILGEKAYDRLSDVPDPIDVVDIFRPADEAPDIVRQAIAVGVEAVWLQKGIVSAEARGLAEEAGIGYVEDLCMGVERSRYGITPDAA